MAWTREYINDLPDSSFAVIEPAYRRGETEDKNARHLPHHGPSGGGTSNTGLDLPHLRNAFARVGQIRPVTDSISKEELVRQARAHLEKHRGALEKAAMERGEFWPLFLDAEEAQESPKRYLFKKELIRAGAYRYGGDDFTVDAPRLKQWEEASNLFLLRGGKIYLPNQHTDNPLENLGWIERFSLEGDVLYAYVDVTDPMAMEKILEGSIRDVSVRIQSDFRDAFGNYYPELITHVALTLEPFIPGQQPFEVVERTLGRPQGPAVKLVMDKTTQDTVTPAPSEGRAEGEERVLSRKVQDLEGKLKEAMEREQALLLERERDQKCIRELSARVEEIERAREAERWARETENARQFVQAHLDVLTPGNEELAYQIYLAALRTQVPPLKLSRSTAEGSSETSLTLVEAFRTLIENLPKPVTYSSPPEGVYPLSRQGPNPSKAEDKQEAKRLVQKYILGAA